MKIGISPITDTIYVGNTRIDKKLGMELWTKKEDITKQAIDTVFQYMYQKSKETGVYQISCKGRGRMVFEKEVEEKVEVQL